MALSWSVGSLNLFLIRAFWVRRNFLMPLLKMLFFMGVAVIDFAGKQFLFTACLPRAQPPTPHPPGGGVPSKGRRLSEKLFLANLFYYIQIVQNLLYALEIALG